MYVYITLPEAVDYRTLTIEKGFVGYNYGLASFSQGIGSLYDVLNLQNNY